MIEWKGKNKLVLSGEMVRTIIREWLNEQSLGLDKPKLVRFRQVRGLDQFVLEIEGKSAHKPAKVEGIARTP